jgi:hypothetical protein
MRQAVFRVTEQPERDHCKRAKEGTDPERYANLLFPTVKVRFHKPATGRESQLCDIARVAERTDSIYA